MTNENSKNDNTYLTLTDTDRKILASYKAMLPNLGEYLERAMKLFSTAWKIFSILSLKM